MKLFCLFFTMVQLGTLSMFAQDGQQQSSLLRVKTKNGILEGKAEASGIRSFKGIPFARPPVAEWRWKEPQPVKNWSGIRKADHFGPKPMQKPIFSDMVFRSDGMSEDCLYLNVWTPARSATEKLPVLVYFYGGGCVAGDGSEPRYDGESLAKKGLVTLTVNYRLGVFGFLAHPELTKESPHHSSGNYGLLDQTAALRWVQQNIAAFGGDPERVTIAGESAGSISVAAQMASPLAKNLIAGAIGESGAMINPTMAPVPLALGEQNGLAFAERVKAQSVSALRALPAAELLDSASKPGAFKTAATVDGYFLPRLLPAVFEAGEQAHISLLAGWNSAEVSYQALMLAEAPTPENYAGKIKQLFAAHADEVLKLYPGTTEEEVVKSATSLASDRFIVYSTWKWADLQSNTGNKPVYRYMFSKIRPPMVIPGAKKGPAAIGAPHASEIEYALGNLSTNKVYAWTADDYKVSELMQQYFANFVKTGNPNSSGLPEWNAVEKGNLQFMNINSKSGQEKEQYRARYLFLDQVYAK